MVSLGHLDLPFSTLQSMPFVSQDSLLLWGRVGDEKVGDRRIYLCLCCIHGCDNVGFSNC